MSVELNIVEGYALQTKPQFRRHLRIALGSAAEVDCLLNIAEELEYIPAADLAKLRQAADKTIAVAFGVLRSSMATD